MLALASVAWLSYAMQSKDIQVHSSNKWNALDVVAYAVYFWTTNSAALIFPREVCSVMDDNYRDKAQALSKMS